MIRAVYFSTFRIRKMQATFSPTLRILTKSVTLRMLLSKTNVIVTAVAKPFRKKRKN